MAAQSKSDDDVSGCLGCLGVLIALAAVVSAVMAIAALVDPFSWVPPIEEMFSDDCHGDKCELEEKYPGVWGHVIVNFAYAVTAVVLAGGLASATSRLRKTRAARFAGADAVGDYRAARVSLTWWALGLVALALIPFLAAVA